MSSYILRFWATCYSIFTKRQQLFRCVSISGTYPGESVGNLVTDFSKCIFPNYIFPSVFFSTISGERKTCWSHSGQRSSPQRQRNISASPILMCTFQTVIFPTVFFQTVLFRTVLFKTILFLTVFFKVYFWKCSRPTHLLSFAGLF